VDPIHHDCSLAEIGHYTAGNDVSPSPPITAGHEVAWQTPATNPDAFG
jgi:hypothetical protein